MASGRHPIQLFVRPDAGVLLFTAGAALLTGILFGLAPAWQAFACAPAIAMRGGARAGETRFRHLFGKSLVVAQVALSVVLLSAAGLFSWAWPPMPTATRSAKSPGAPSISMPSRPPGLPFPHPHPRGSRHCRAAVRRTVRDLLKTVPVAKVTTLAAQVDASIVPERLIATLSGRVRRPRDSARRHRALRTSGLHGGAPHPRDRRPLRPLGPAFRR